MDDEALIRRAEEVLSEIDRTTGLSDEHADVLAALRLRIHGGPRQSLDDVLKAAGEMKGKRSLEDLPEPAGPKSSLDDLFGAGEKKKEWPSG